MTERLESLFFARPAQQVAPDLLGKRLARCLPNGRLLSGLIVETEAYGDVGGQDMACHGDRTNHGRPTRRTAVMFGPAGFAYVYFTYGMHWLFNIVTGQPGQSGAVLIRALEPLDGLEEMQRRRDGRSRHQLTNGPAKLAQALAIDQALNGANLCAPDGVIWLEDAPLAAPQAIYTGPRIGLGKTPEPWLSMPWRFWLGNNPHVSKSSIANRQS
jgi:DNA-3-methyladenine glycosylase